MYEVALFGHVVGAVGLFMAIAVEMFAGAKLRRSKQLGEVRTLSSLSLMIEPLFPVSTVLLLGTGFYLASDRWSLTDGWVVVALAAVALFSITGPTVQGRRLKAIAADAAEAGDGPVPASLSAAIADPVLWASAHAAAVGAVGVLWLMTNKPSLAVSVAVELGSVALGAAVGFMGARKQAPQAV